MKANIWLHKKREQAYLDSGLVEVYRSPDATPSKAGILLHPALDTTTPQLSQHSSIIYRLIRSEYFCFLSKADTIGVAQSYAE